MIEALAQNTPKRYSTRMADPVFLLCFVPFLIAAAIFLKKTSGFTLPRAAIAALVGLIALVPISFLQQIIFLPRMDNSVFFRFAKSLIVNGLIEETVKSLFVFLLLYRAKNFSVFFASSLCAALALGGFEALIYAINGSQTIVLRLFTAVILHAACTGLASFSVWSWQKLQARKRIAPYFLAVACHGVYNFFAGMYSVFWWLSLVCLLFAIVQCAAYYRANAAINN